MALEPRDELVASRIPCGWGCADTVRRCARLQTDAALRQRAFLAQKMSAFLFSLTVDALHRVDEVSDGELCNARGLEVGQDTGSGRDLFVEVLLRPAVVLEGELDGCLAAQVGVKDSEGVELCLVVSSDLVGSDEQLDLGWRRQAGVGSARARTQKKRTG